MLSGICNQGKPFAVFCIGLFLISFANVGSGKELSPADMAREHMRRGKQGLEEGQLAKACFEFHSATKVLSNWWIPQLEYVRCARILGEDPQQLLLQLEQILTVDEERASLHHLKGILLEDLSRLEEAANSYRRALQIAPWMVEPTIGLARTLLATGAQEEALAVSLAALERRPLDILLLNQVAGIYESQGANEKAIVILERLVLVSNRPTGILARLVRAYEAVGDDTGRRDALKRLRARAQVDKKR